MVELSRHLQVAGASFAALVFKLVVSLIPFASLRGCSTFPNALNPIRFAQGLFPIAFGYWIVRFTPQASLCSFSENLTTPYTSSFIAFALSLAHNKKTPLERISAKWGVHHERISKSAVNTCCNAICQAIFFMGKTTM
jgi:hypothetical protein